MRTRITSNTDTFYAVLAFSTAQKTLYKPRAKYFFRNCLIDSSAAFVEIPSELNPVVIYDAMVAIHSVPSQPHWYKLKESTGLQAERIYRDYQTTKTSLNY